MDKAEISKLQQQSVAHITEQLPNLDREALVELSALETASGTPRSTLATEIDKRLAELAEDGEGDPPNCAPPVAEPKAEKITKDDYRHPDYHGPLSGEQANWRVLNLKPVRKVITK